MTDHTPRDVSTHYQGLPDLTVRLLDALRAGGKHLDQLTPAELAPVDQFHTAGRDATLELARRANLQPEARVLDVGGGIGGPARTLASEFGCVVTVLDLTESYCQAGAVLTDLLQLSTRVSFRRGDALAMPFANGSFDVVWSQHSSMNISDKNRLYREMWRVLRPGGRLAFHEVMAGPVQPVHFPVPWASDPSISFLVTPNAIRSLLGEIGYEEVDWADTTAYARAWFQAWSARPAASATPGPLGLHLLLGPEFPIMGRNQVRNLAEDRIAVIQAVFDRG